MLAACSQPAVHDTITTDAEYQSAPAPVPAPPALSDFYSRRKDIEESVDRLYAAMTPEQRAAQMIMVASSTTESIGTPYETARKLVDGGMVGNVLFLKGATTEFARQTKELNRLLQGKGQVKPLYACDCEPTLFHRKWTDIKAVKPAADQKEAAMVEEEVRKIDSVMKVVGVQLNFAPIADIAANKSVINKRSFSRNADSVALLASAFVTASQQDGIAATVKHFPGHGAVKGDSHKQAVFIDGDMKELNTFKRIIRESKPISVMVGHITVRNNPSYNTNELPASLSSKIVTGLLRKELGFDGIITTDALNMQAAANMKDGDWKAVLAGNDLILMPLNPTLLHQKITAALKKDDALSRQLEASVKRILRLKVCLSIA